MTRFTLDECWTAKWMPKYSYDVTLPREAPPTSLLDAVRFVMEQLQPDVRTSAWIEAESKTIPFDEIQVIYANSELCKRLPGISRRTPENRAAATPHWVAVRQKNPEVLATPKDVLLEMRAMKLGERGGRTGALRSFDEERPAWGNGKKGARGSEQATQQECSSQGIRPGGDAVPP
jgi:hypothetical protein